MATVRETAIAIARAEIQAGAREIGGNNRGPFVKKYLAPTGLGEGHAWCAAFVSWCFKQAAERNGVPMPFRYTAGARNLYNQGVKRGWKVETPLPGDIVCWTRGGRHDGLGHVGLVEYAHDVVMQAIEGNHTADVARFRYEWEHEPRLLGFIRVKA